MDMSVLRQLHFLHPGWLLLLPLVLALAGWMRFQQSRSGAWAKVMDEDLVPSLRLESGRSASGPWLLFAAVWTLALLAIASPAWERLPSVGYQAPDDWLIVLDLSPSMSVADVSPDRATRARFVIDDLLGAAQDARVGLIAFAGEAHTVVPLTSDVATIRGLLPPLSPTIMPESGDAMGPALTRAGQLLRQSGSRHAEVIVLSDGSADAAEAITAAQGLAAQGAQVQVVGIGTADGAPLKDAKGAFVHDEQGRSVMAKLPVDELRRIASTGRGQYWLLDQLKDLIRLLGERHANPLRDERTATDQQVASWRNEGFWLMPPILLLAILLARRGWV